MPNMNALDAFVPILGGAILATTTIGTIGVTGSLKKVYQCVKGDKKQDGINNKIQSITATIFSIGLGLIFSGFFPASLYIGFGLALALNIPHIAKLFVQDKEVKEKLDNIAGVAGATFNSLGLIPLVAVVVAIA